MDQARADGITMMYGKGKLHYAPRHLPYYADLLPSLVVHEIRAKQTRPESLYITNGLSLSTPESAVGYGFELQMIAPGDKLWPVTLLISLAANTFRTNTQFGPGQSVALTHALNDSEVEFQALLFTRAPGLPDMLMMPEGAVRLVTVVGITADEYEWAKRYSAHDLIAQFQLCGQGVATLPSRRSIVAGTRYTTSRLSA